MKKTAFWHLGTTALLLCAITSLIITIAGCGFSSQTSAEDLTKTFLPIVTCSANPASVVSGNSTQISTKAVSPLGLPLTYSYSATGGTLNSQGQTATLNTQGTSGSIGITCKAVDTKGNQASFTTSVNVQPGPSAPISVTCQANPSRVAAGGTVAILTLANSPEGRPLTYSWNASSGTISGNGYNATLDTGGVAAGIITVTCNVADDQGRTASATTTVTVNAAAAPTPLPAPPSISCSANPAAVTLGATVTITAVASSPEGRALTYSWRTSAGTISGIGNTATLNTDGASAGAITVTCTVADDQGRTASATTMVTVNAPAPSPAPPSISCSANPAAVTLGATATLTAVASSPEGRPLTYSWRTSAGTIFGTGNTATLNTSGAAAGAITVTCTVADDQGRTASATTMVTVNAPTPSPAPPSISCAANPSTITIGGTVAITAVASSPEGRPLTYTWSASAGTISGTGNTATLDTSGVAAGTITVTCTVTDNQGLTASATTTVTATPGNPVSTPPSISCSANPPAVTLGGTTTITAVASSPEGRPLTYSWNTSAGTISGAGNTANLNTSGATTATITVTCKVADDQGRSASATTAVTVNVPPPAPAPPSISCSANPASITIGGNVAIVAVASSPEGRALTYSWSTTAGTISGNGNTATLDTNGAAPGTITVTCTVTDNQGLTASATVTVTAGAPASAPPSISCSANPPTVTLGGTATITAVANSPEGRPLTYNWSASAGTISGTGNIATLNTSGATAGTVTVTCNVADDQGRSASATTTISVTAPVSTPPTITCSANPSSTTAGGSVAITAVATSPEGRPLTYSWSTSAGSISGTGNTATLNTGGAPAGIITVTCTVDDDQGRSASATTAVTVNAPGPGPGIEPPMCVPPTITQPAPIVSTPVPIALPTGTTINVMLNGATGDGHTNDSPALQSIVNNNPNAVIYFPLGDYVLDNPSPNQAGLLFSGFHGTAIMANGARFLCDTATTSAGQCIEINNSSGASFDNFRVGYTEEQNLPLSRTSAISNGILVVSSSTLNFGNTTIEASTGSGIWVTNSTGVSFLGGTSVSNTTADGLHFENVGNATVVGYTGRNTGDDTLAATNIAPSNPNCGLNASNIQVYQSHSRGIAVAGACGSSFSNFYIENTSNSGLGVVQDQTINSRIPDNNTFSNGTVVNAGHYPGIPGSKDCIDIAESSGTTVSNVECSTPMIDGLFVFGGADQVTISGVTVDAAANVGLQAVGSTNVSLSNTVNRNSVNAGYAIQSLQGGSMVGVTTCSSGGYGFYHSATTSFTESNLMSYDSAEKSSSYRVWWAENSSNVVSVNGLSILDDQTHTAPDVVGGTGDPAGSLTVDGITQDLLGSTLSLQLP